MEEVKCLYEEFSSFKGLLEIMDKRPNNKVMMDRKSSSDNDRSFTGTNNYQEAINLFIHGYTDILTDIKREVRKNNKIIQKNPILRRKVQNMPIGFIPNVPNAIQNKPDSMINIINTPQKNKTLSIIYAMGANAFENAETFIKAGAALVSAINLIELSGIQTRLLVDFMPAYHGERNGEPAELVAPVLRIKNYGERFNLTKICFPLAHPSMFRRFGFKYLETCPQLTNTGFHFGYGQSPSLEKLRKNIPSDGKTCIINTGFIKENHFDIEKIIDEIKENTK